MKLYDYFRSSAAFRVRIALNLKGIRVERQFVHLRRNEHRAADFAAINPQGLVPVLVDQGRTIAQSLAIIEYLEETHPQPPLLPATPVERARVRALALAVACDIHPLNNLRILRYLVGPLGASEEQKDTWYRHWIAVGLSALEGMLAGQDGTGCFCHGDGPTLADICLVPQVYNAERFACDLTPYPTVRRIAEACRSLSAFADAAPEKQPDAE